jgi:hypothetical protein
MNGREAIEAMLAGKVVSRGGALYRFRDGFERLAGILWVPDCFVGAGTYELHVEPNPHEPGTYAWAREEHAQGRDVTNAVPGPGRVLSVYRACNKWGNFVFCAAEFETKTWRHA